MKVTITTIWERWDSLEKKEAASLPKLAGEIMNS